MRVGAIILVTIMLAAPAASIVSLRPVHNVVLDTFVPQPADVPGEPIDGVCINLDKDDCEGGPDQNSPGETTSPNGVDQLWRDDNGDIIGATAPFHQCGDPELEMSIGNPFPLHVPNGDDVDPASQGIIRADGGLYVVPEINRNGEPAQDVEAVWFGFLHTAPSVPGVLGPDDICDLTGPTAGIGVSGAYYEFYRGDHDPSDGWLIPINTHLVPDNIYGAVLRAFGAPAVPGDSPPGGLVPLQTGFTYAIVDNLEEDEQWRPCTPPGCENRDLLPPWPTVVPGDVTLEQATFGDGAPGDDLLIEFGERIQPSSLNVQVCRPDISFCTDFAFDEVADSRDRDVDSVPLFTLQRTSFGHEVVIDMAGSGFGSLQDGDTITVSASDDTGNSATKTVTVFE